MRTIICSVVLSCAICGCSSGGKVIVGEPATRDFLAEFEQAATEAKNTIQSAERLAAASAKRSHDSSDEVKEEEMPLDQQVLQAVQPLLGMAQQLVIKTAGQPTESDAKGILTDVKELIQKAQKRAPPDEVTQAVDQLQSKISALKQKV